ncbi:zinc metallopeptidase [Methyloligella solikamskensis]|uniref:Zinc metallopeptidase n=1 Tax=Methyloligella solikamskensis TaxID=1177756 RepID=A0ABW3JBY7_9HYPH
MFEDPLFWLFVGPGLLLGLYAQARIKSNVAKYSQVKTPSGITGAEVARRLLDAKGLQDVRIEPVEGELSDHYDPRNKVLRLSQKVFYTPSIAAAGIAAHEAGHAVQDAKDYFPMEARTYVVPLVQIASKIAPWLFVAGLVLGMNWLTWAGVILFGSSFFFALLTLPVEFNASARAKELLARQGILGPEEIESVDKVLDAAAWTYVSAAVSAVGVWLFYIFMLFSRGAGASARR